MKKPAFPSDQQDKFMLRLPEGMREQIKVAAENNKRSMNSEIVARVAATFSKYTHKAMMWQILSYQPGDDGSENPIDSEAPEPDKIETMLQEILDRLDRLEKK